jgi:class 3 adenylate cyclase
MTGTYAEVAQTRTVNNLGKADKLDRNRILTDEILQYLRQLNTLTRSRNVLALIAQLAMEMDPSGALYSELESSTRSALVQQKLVDQSTELQNVVRAKEQEIQNVVRAKEEEIQNLSLAAARERAMAEYHRKVADSLYFVGLIDSLTVLQQEQALVEQAATIELQESELELQEARSRSLLIIVFSAFLGLGLVTVFYLRSRQLNHRLAAEKERSEELLLNILPKDIAEELKANGQVEPRFYEHGTILFTDFADFSKIAQTLPADRLIKDLDECFQLFDKLAGKYGIEKIKTIGDAYMCIGGVPIPDQTAVSNMILFALDLQQKLNEWNANRANANLPLFQARIGIHTGPVVAGVVGLKKFSYDVWGDSVNVAARMENQGAAGKVNVSVTTYELVKKDFHFTARGEVAVKHMAPMQMYFVEGIRVHK